MRASIAFALLASVATMVSAAPLEPRADEFKCADDGSSCTVPAGHCYKDENGTDKCDNPGDFAPKDVLFNADLDFWFRQSLIDPIPESVIYKVLGGDLNLAPADQEYHDQIRHKIAHIAKLSAQHAREIRDVISWGVEFGLEEKTGDMSYYIGGSGAAGKGRISLSRNDYGEGKDVTAGAGIISHELGHAVFDHGGYQKVTNDRFKEFGLDDTTKYGSLEGTINEPFAGMFGCRYEWYLAKKNHNVSDDPAAWRYCSFAFDVSGKFDNPDSMYYKYYHLTPQSVEALPKLLEIGEKDLLPRLAEEYGLKDKYLMAPASDFPKDTSNHV